MRNHATVVLSVLALLTTLGCGEDEACSDCATDGSGGAGQGGGSNQASVGSGGLDGGDWTTLITGEWQLPAGGEITSDVHLLVLDEDVFVGAIRPISPVGTHHTVLALGDNGFGNIIYASGVGTNAIVFPEGVGLKLSAGETLALQLHVFNTSGDMLAGTSGIEIIEVAPDDVEHEADLYLPGPLNLNIAPQQTTTHTGTCTVNTTQNFFAVFPHMHQLGTHFKTTFTVDGTPNVIHDAEYEFDHQAFISFETVTLQPGDSITSECTWENLTEDTVSWGESSTSEMCFSILYRYPAQGGEAVCGE